MATPLHSETTGLLVALLATCTSGRGENLNVLPKNSGKTMMRSYLRRLADADFARRKKVIASLTSVEKIEQHQQRMQTFFWRQLGGMPKRTPLNAKIVGRLRVDRCRIEKVIFESRPNHFVTATLYLPVGKGPFPAVLIPCGHTHAGKASNQRLGIFFAQSGIAAFTYDPIGQGERYQILDGKGKNRFKSTTEHTLVGISCILVGRSTASYRVWDGIRAIDYLVSRKDIDSSRIGCTGVSGGGTLTEYLMALDERIQCAAPACAPMTFARRLATIGPGDAEQNIYGQIAFGMDHSDYTHMRAPKPTLILAATRDFVDIQGAWDLFREAKQIYTRMGKSERVDIIEADAKHGFSLKLREGSVRWMRRWLLGKDDAVSEPEVKTLPFRQLLCTKTGQAQQIENAKSVMDLNLDVVKKYEATRKELWKPGNRKKALSMVRRLAGIRELSKIPKPKMKSHGIAKRNGVEIEKLTLTPEKGITLPALLFKPMRLTGDKILYANGTGKQKIIATAEALAKEGNLVLAIDVRGIGETGSTTVNRWGGSFDDIFLAYLLGKSIVGMRTEDLLVAARYLSEIGKSSSIDLIASDTLCVPAQHAYALERQLFSGLTLKNTTRSWVDIVRDPTKNGQLVNVVHGALTVYDLTDLKK